MSLSCEICIFKAKSISGLKRHINCQQQTSATNGNTFNCDQCDYKAISGQDLMSHAEIHQQKVPVSNAIRNDISNKLELLKNTYRKLNFIANDEDSIMLESYGLILNNDKDIFIPNGPIKNKEKLINNIINDWVCNVSTIRLRCSNKY